MQVVGRATAQAAQELVQVLWLDLRMRSRFQRCPPTILFLTYLEGVFSLKGGILFADAGATAAHLVQDWGDAAEHLKQEGLAVQHVQLPADEFDRSGGVVDKKKNNVDYEDQAGQIIFSYLATSSFV